MQTFERIKFKQKIQEYDRYSYVIAKERMKLRDFGYTMIMYEDGRIETILSPEAQKIDDKYVELIEMLQDFYFGEYKFGGNYVDQSL